jgi:hypothetical protein
VLGSRRLTVVTVGLTGIIYGGIVCLWLCYLVPLALRRHDETTPTRSVDRFSSAMRVLGREARPTSPAAVRRAARIAASRRRRVLIALLVVVLVVSGLVVAGLVPAWAPAVPGALVIGFLVIARRQVSKARTKGWERSLRATAGSAHGPSARPLGSPAGTGGVGAEPDDAPTVEFDAVPDDRLGGSVHERADGRVDEHALEQQQVMAAAVATVDGTTLWDPLPVTLPTYVSKPRAERSIRTIDLSGPGAWTSGHLADEEQSGVPSAENGSDPGSEAGPEAGSQAGSEAVVAAAPRAVGD